MTRRAAWFLTLAIGAAPACDGATAASARTPADAAGLDAADAEVGVDAADAQDEPECVVHSDCVPAGGDDPKHTCRVHECVNGACEEVPVSSENHCWWVDPISSHEWTGRCLRPGECVGCADALEGWGLRTCEENPLCCWATVRVEPWPWQAGTQMACFGTCVDGMCLEPDGGCKWY